MGDLWQAKPRVVRVGAVFPTVGPGPEPASFPVDPGQLEEGAEVCLSLRPNGAGMMLPFG